MEDRLTNQVGKEERDLRVLRVVIESGPIGIGTIAAETDIPEHKVRYSLRMLEDDALVDPTPNGAVPAEDIDERVAAINAGIDDLTERLDDLKNVF